MMTGSDAAPGANSTILRKIEDGTIAPISQVKLRGIQGPVADTVFTMVGTVMVLYTLYVSFFGIPSVMVHRPLHVIMILIIAPLAYPSNLFKPGHFLEKWMVIFLLVAGTGSGTYVLLSWERLFRHGSTSVDIVVIAILTVTILECTRRAIGLPIVLIALATFAYALLGPLMPPVLAHRGYSFYRIVNILAIGTEGFYGSPIGASSTFIIAFLVLAALLQATGALKHFMKLAFSIAGGQAGGAAKVAVVSSGLTGIISGSTVANVTATGSITIPLMKQTGFQPTTAGAVEAVASAGGSITPPVMGATAFLIAEFLGIGYWEVVKAAIIPAILYYASLFNVVHIRSVKGGLLGLPRKELPFFWPALKEAFHLLVPLLILVVMMAEQYTAMYAAFWTMVALLFFANLKSSTRTSLSNLIKAVRLAGRTIIPISTACATAGIIVAMLNITGVSLKIGYVITDLAGGKLLVALILTQIAALIMGTGLVTAGTYIILAVLCAPALVKMGAVPLAAHMFIFHFAIIGTLTPPVCMAAYAAAGIADSNPMQTGFTAFRLAIPGFLVPYFFVMNPSLIGIGSIFDILSAFMTAVIGVVFIGYGLEGYVWGRFIKPWERILAGLGGVLLVYPSLFTSIAGFVLALGTLALVKSRAKVTKKVAA